MKRKKSTAVALKPPRPSTVHAATPGKLAQASDLRKQGMGWEQIAEVMGCATNTAKMYVQKARRCAMFTAIESARSAEAERLQTLHDAAMSVVRAFVPVVFGGEIVLAPPIDPISGMVMLDADNKPLKAPDGSDLAVPIRDHSLVLAAIDRALKTGEALRKLHGIDVPVVQRSEVAIKPGAGLPVGMTPGQFQAAIADGIAQIKALSAPRDMGAVDVVSREKVMT